MEIVSRPLRRTDLPATRTAGTSLGMSVLLGAEIKRVSDIHFGNNELCYLEDAKGEPTRIEDLRLIFGDTWRKENANKLLPCEEPEVDCLNSDANCYVDEFINGNYGDEFTSWFRVENNPDLCRSCIYNTKQSVDLIGMIMEL